MIVANRADYSGAKLDHDLIVFIAKSVRLKGGTGRTASGCPLIFGSMDEVEEIEVG